MKLLVKTSFRNLRLLTNNLGYYNKMDVNNLLGYPGESDTWLEVHSLEKIVDTIRKSVVDDEVEDDTIPLKPVTHKETLI